MACYRRLVIFTLFKIEVKITKISFCCCFHCDFQLLFYLSFLFFFSERRLHCSVFIFEKKSLYWTLNSFKVFHRLFLQTRQNFLYRNHGFLKRRKLSSRTTLMKNNGLLIKYAKSIPLRTGLKSLFSSFWIDLKKMDRWIGDLVRKDLKHLQQQRMGKLSKIWYVHKKKVLESYVTKRNQKRRGYQSLVCEKNGQKKRIKTI